MKIESEKLIQDLVNRTQFNIDQVKRLSVLSLEKLNTRIRVDSWSVLECLEHLNLYGDFYIPEIRQRIESSNSISKKYFKSGVFGNYFANSMLPNEKLNTMKTFKDKNPIGNTLDKTTITRFISQQEQLLILLQKSKNIDLNTTKTAISISKWIKLKLGDTFRVVIYHNERHMVQVEKIMGDV